MSALADIENSVVCTDVDVLTNLISRDCQWDIYVCKCVLSDSLNHEL